MTVRNVDWLISRLKWVVNFNDGQVNQDFAGPSTDANLHWREALNEAYKTVVHNAQKVTSRHNWRKCQDVVWPVSTTTLTIPYDLAQAQVQRIRDITSEEDGTAIFIGNSPGESELWRLDKDTLQWGVAGPAAETTLRFEYLARAEELTSGNQEPELIPADYRMLIVWEAAIFLRSIADERTPKAWVDARDAMQKTYNKSISQGWGMETNPPVIRNNDSD